MSQERATIHLVPHFHYHSVYIEDQRTCAALAFDLVSRYLEACRKDDSYHVLLSEFDYLRPFLAVHSEQRGLVRDLIAAGRLSTAGAYNQPSELLIQGEGLIRNLLYGRLYHEDVLGAEPVVHMPFDVFGHCLQLPQIAAKCGFQALIWSKPILGAPPLCWVVSPDGTAVLQRNVCCVYTPHSLDELLETAGDALAAQAKLGLNHDLRLLGGDMTGPLPWLVGRAGELAQHDPRLVLSTPERYLAAVAPEAHLRSAVIPSLGQDFSWYHTGTLVTRAELKIANRLAENRLVSAEKWATLAALLGAQYPDPPLDKAWRQLLFAQHHDAITGTSSDIPFLDLLAGYREALELAADVEENALRCIAASVDTAPSKRGPREGSALVVFNSLGWPRTDICRVRVDLDAPLASGFGLADENGREVPCQIVARSGEGAKPSAEIVFIASDVPSVGYRVYYLSPASAPPPTPTVAESPEAIIENEYLSLRADAERGGGLVSLFDKRLQKELLDTPRGPGNEITALAERADRERPPWELFTTGAVARARERQARVSVVQGPVFGQLRIAAEMPGRCELLQEITLYRGIPRVDLRTTLHQYRGQHELLALTFPLAIRGAVPTFEDRFAAVVRRRSRGMLDFRTLEQHNLSQCGIGGAQNWVDVGPAPSLKVVSGGEAVRALPLGPCAIITSSDLKDRVAVRAIQKALLSRGVTCAHWLDTQVADADTRASAIGWSLYISLGSGNSYSRQLLDRAPEAAALLAQGTAEREWGAVLLRGSDPQGELPDLPVLILETAQPGGLPRLAEMLAAEIAGGSLEIREEYDFSGLARPTDDHGMALINRGSLAASLESDGTLVALLFHTASWSNHPWGEGRLERFFVPEHKSHVFAHSLYPHAGDWRRGGVVKAGYEVNNPLCAVQVPIQRGPLPVQFSLISLDAPNVVITAIKPLGNPLAAHKTTARSHPESGFVVRVYECEGRPHTDVQTHFAAEPQEAWFADLVERRGREVQIAPARRRQPARVSFPLGACEIATLVVKLAPLADRGEPQELGPVTEPHQPIHCRYWDHNLGAAPMGNQPLTVWLRGEIPIGRNTRFPLGLSNDSLNRELAGVVDIIAPSHWTLIPRQVPYRLAPGSQAVYEIMVDVPPDARPCFLRAVTQCGEQMLQDVISIGEIVPLEVKLAREEQRFVVQVRNPNPDYVEGQVALITPLESWGSLVDTFALTAVAPRLYPFRLDPSGQEVFRFAVRGDMSSLWAVAKVMWYGRVQYVQESAPG